MATTGYVNGTLIGLYIGTEKICSATSTQLTVNQATRTSVNKDDEGWEKNFGGTKSFELSGDSEFKFDDDYGPSDILSALMDNTELTAKWSTEVTGDMVISGQVIVTSFSVSANAEETVTYSYSLKGNGKPTKSTVS